MEQRPEGRRCDNSARLTLDIAGGPISGAGEDYDALKGTGTAQLRGELVVNVSPPIVSNLAPSDVFTVLTAAGLSGSFANDGDGYTDYPADPACQSAASTQEKTQCQDGLNNDHAAGIDFGGGAWVNGGVPIATADPQCVGMPWRNREAGSKACGLGFEVALALLPLALARKRRERLRDPPQP